MPGTHIAAAQYLRMSTDSGFLRSCAGDGLASGTMFYRSPRGRAKCARTTQQKLTESEHLSPRWCP